MKLLPVIRHVLEFVSEVTHHWGSLVTSGAIIGAIGIWQGTGHKVNAILYWIIALAGLFISSFKAWNVERQSKEVAVTKAIAESRITSEDWKELSEKFEKRMHVVVIAQWTHWSYNDQHFWTLTVSPREQGGVCEQLCRLAGTMLLKSPCVLPELSALTISIADPRDRWLNYLRECHAATERVLHGTETLDDGTKNNIISAVIGNVMHHSIGACLYCAEREL